MNSPQDDPLVREVRRTLERGTAVPDAELDRRVRAALAGQGAGAPRPHTGERRAWLAGGLALAAGVSAFVLLPMLQREPAVPVPPAEPAVHMAVPSEDPEFLENLELLDTLGDTADAT